MIITSVFTVAMLVARVAGHGYLMDPPARNSAWRVDPDSHEPNYTDNEQNCGGFENQWKNHDGKCGICGDPYQGPPMHEAGGLYAKLHRNVTRCYNKADDVIDIHVVITSHHKGYFEFRLCEHNNMATRAEQSCFDNGILLTIHETGLTRYDINEKNEWDYFFRLDMPRDVTCTQCILQWKYNAGNNWGCDDTGCGIGLGQQEQFINCADIAILENCAVGMTSPGTPMPSESTTSEPPSTSSPETTSASTPPATTPTASTTTLSVTPTGTATPPTGSTFRCRGVGDWNDPVSMEWWCTNVCYHDYDKCKRDMCICNRAP